MPDDTNLAVTAAQAAVNAQVEAQRAAEECRAMMARIRAYEARRPIVKETIREVGSGGEPVDVSPLEAAVSDISARVSALENRPDSPRIDALERMVMETRDMLRAVPRSEVMSPVVSDVMDRMAALETLVTDSLAMPETLARQLRMTAEVMEAMDERAKALRASDQAMLEQHRKVAEQTAVSQGGVIAVVESMKLDMDQLTQAVAHLKHQINIRDAYTAKIIQKGAA